VEVVASEAVICCVAYAVVGEASLPNGKLRCDSVGEAALDELHRALDSDTSWGDKKVDVVRHDDVGVEQVVVSVMVEGLEKKLGVAFDLEEPAAVVGCGGDEVGARSGGAGGDRHSAIVSVPQRLKPLYSANCYGTAKAVPLSKTDRVCAIAHLSDDKAVVKMGHPIVVVWSDVGHPSSKISRATAFPR
jgi:hypothetical protein